MDIGQRAQLVNLINSPGWTLAKFMGEEVLKAMDHLAFEADDDDNIPRLVRDAKAARKFWEAWIGTLNAEKDPANKIEMYDVATN